MPAISIDWKFECVTKTHQNQEKKYINTCESDEQFFSLFFPMDFPLKPFYNNKFFYVKQTKKTRRSNVFTNASPTKNCIVIRDFTN